MLSLSLFHTNNFYNDYVLITITVIYTEKPSADFSAKTITKTAEGFFLDGVSVELVALLHRYYQVSALKKHNYLKKHSFNFAQIF